MTGGLVGAVLLVVGVIGSTILVRRRSGKGHPEEPRSGVTTDPNTHLNEMHMKRNSKRSSARQAKPQVSHVREYDKKPNGVQTSPTKVAAAQGRKNSTGNKSPAQPEVSQGPPLPDHTVLTKNKELRANAKELAEKKDVLEAEYRSLLGYVNKNVNKTRLVAQLDENRVHSRYMDIGKTVSIECTDSEYHFVCSSLRRQLCEADLTSGGC